nr:hypothetical protein [Tanacetum cinerariifolium]
VRLIEDCQLGIMGLVGITWDGTGAHGMSEGSVTVRVRVQVLTWGRWGYSKGFWRESLLALVGAGCGFG